MFATIQVEFRTLNLSSFIAATPALPDPAALMAMVNDTTFGPVAPDGALPLNLEHGIRTTTAVYLIFRNSPHELSIHIEKLRPYIGIDALKREIEVAVRRLVSYQQQSAQRGQVIGVEIWFETLCLVGRRQSVWRYLVSRWFDYLFVALTTSAAGLGAGWLAAEKAGTSKWVPVAAGLATFGANLLRFVYDACTFERKFKYEDG